MEIVLKTERVIEIIGSDFKDIGGADWVVFVYLATSGISVVIYYLCPSVIVCYCGIAMAVAFFFNHLAVNSGIYAMQGELLELSYCHGAVVIGFNSNVVSPIAIEV